MTNELPNVFIKDPNADLDYQWDWSVWLADGETIEVVVITMPDGLTLDSQVDADTTVTAWFSGGTVDEGYQVVCHIETSNDPPRKDDRSIYIICRQR